MMTDEITQEPDFEGDRAVIREAEEVKPEKPGWFSKRTKKKSLQTTAASRPPSAASFGSSRRKGSSKMQEDDLPPRTDATSSPLHSPAPTESSGAPTPPGRRTPDSTPEVPVHAGFDLAAIKHMIGEAERHPEQLLVPQPRPDRDTPVPVSSPLAPRSSPIRQAETVTSAVKSVPYDGVVDGDTSGRNVPDPLSATFTASLTVHDRDPYGPIEKAGKEQREAKVCSEASNTLSRAAYPPEMGLAWTSPKPSDVTFGNPFAGSPEGLSFGSSTRYLAQSPYARDRLGTLGGGSTPSASSPGLSFGSPDGTITLQGMEPDPWNTPAEIRNTTGNGLGMNPWSM